VLTVESLLGELDLKLAAGQAEAASPIRWVHISEIEDPTPWLAGGELLLTTGIQLGSAERQRDFVRLLAGHGLAGMGLGTGFDHKRLPKALVSEAKRLKFPLFEVPYEMPFIAITEKAFTRLVNEQYDVLTRGTELNERLERLVIEERGLPEVLGSVSGAIGGSALVLDGRGQVIARSRRSGLPRGAATKLGKEVAERATGRRAGPFVPEHSELEERALALPVPARGQGLPRAWLVVVREEGPLGDFERLCARQAAIVVALELMRERTVRETERRLAGDVLAEALTGRLEPDEIRGRLRPFGIGDRAAVLVFHLDDPAAAEDALEAALSEAGSAGLVAEARTPRGPLLCAVVDASSGDPIELAGRARTALAAKHGPVRAAASRSAPVESLRRGFHEARCALEATSLSDGDAPEVASHRDLGAFTLLLALQDDEALRSYSDTLLAPIEADGQYGDELLRSLEAYIEQNGQWERAARELYCHRHTLRYRIRRVEELTGRDLGSAHARIELWLALRARELVR
jgi:purine catabolism regulator